MSSTEEDEFDIAGRESTPQGVHRRPRSVARLWLAIVAVLIIAPLLAYGAIVLLGRTDAPVPPPINPDATETAEQDEDLDGEGPGDADSDSADSADEGDQDVDGESSGGEAAPEDDATDPDDGEADDPTDSEDPGDAEDDGAAAADVDYFAGVAVLNGTGVDGLAAQVSQELISAGFTGATAGDYSSAQPTISAVYYRDPALQATAAEVAGQLGITPVQQLDSASAEIVVVLRNDYTG